MNMVKRSTEMKKPNTPTLRRQNHMKNSFTPSFIFHEAKVPVKTIIAESSIMATEIPSTPTAYSMFNGLYHMKLSVRSISAVCPSALIPRNINTSATARPSRTDEPATMTACICLVFLDTHSPSIISSGTAGKSDNIFIS